MALSIGCYGASVRAEESSKIAGAEFSRDATRELDEFVAPRLLDSRLPGLSVVLFNRERVLLTRSYGFASLADGREVSDSTVFMIASISKVVTGATLMRLWEKRGFDLDADINQFLDFSVRNPYFPSDKITFRQLLTHTSSINEALYLKHWHTSFKSVGDSQIPLREFIQGYLLPGGSWYDKSMSWHDAKPGATWGYSNVGFSLAGYLVQRVGGQPLDQVSTQEIFNPLGMSSCKWRLGQTDSGALATTYSYDAAARRFMAIPADGFPDWPAGTLRCTAVDLAKFWMMILGSGTFKGTSILKESTLRTMLEDQVPGIAPAYQGLAFQGVQPNDSRWIATPSGIDAREREEAGTYIGHNGGDDGAASLAWVDMHNQIGAVVLANGDWGAQSTPFLQNVVELLLHLGRTSSAQEPR
jgi:CubicO group peptidase (beta-lactamase class C family)